MSLQLLNPLIPFLPEVQKPIKETPIREKIIYTFLVVLIFLVCSQIPLYGIRSFSKYDPWHWSRMIMASNRGSLMELGISPIVTSGMLLQLLSGAGLIRFDQSNREDRVLFEAAQKFLGIGITVVQAIAYIVTGVYGDARSLGINAVFIVIQLLCAGFLVILLDELMQKGYGLGSAISLFITTNICESIIWKAFSPFKFQVAGDLQFEGAIIALFHLLFTRHDKLQALKDALWRQNMPNLMNLSATIILFFVIVYFQGFRVDIPIRSKISAAASGTYPIKLFYTSNIPIILQAALVSNFFFLSQMLFKYFPNILIRMLGTWQQHPYYTSQSIPVGGIAYYISPPGSLEHILTDPIHAIAYIAFVLITCSLFSRTWVEFSGSSPADVAKQLKGQNMMIKGHRDDSILKVLNKYIPTAATLGGFCIGILSITADTMGAFGSGTGILLAVTTIYSTFEVVSKEQAKAGLSLF